MAVLTTSRTAPATTVGTSTGPPPDVGRTDTVDEWGQESFPASDPPQSWCHEPARVGGVAPAQARDRVVPVAQAGGAAAGPPPAPAPATDGEPPAPGWDELGIAPGDVAGWEAAGLGPFEAALAWGDGFTASMAVHQRRQLRRTAGAWARNGLGSAEGLRWHRAGFPVGEAVRWRGRGVDVEEAGARRPGYGTPGRQSRRPLGARRSGGRHAWRRREGAATREEDDGRN